MQYWQVIKRVHEAYRGITARLADLTGTVYQIWQAHGAPPPTFNRESYGKKWRVLEEYLEAVDLYEQAAKGAGVMLSEDLNNLVRAKYTDTEQICQRTLVNSLIKESTEAATELNKKDFEAMSSTELESSRREIMQAVEKSRHALDVVDSVMRERAAKREIEADTFAGLHGHAGVN